MSMYRVMWRSKITGFCGRGEPMSKENAQVWADWGNENHPDIEHWIEEEAACANT